MDVILESTGMVHSVLIVNLDRTLMFQTVRSVYHVMPATMHLVGATRNVNHASQEHSIQIHSQRAVSIALLAITVPVVEGWTRSLVGLVPLLQIRTASPVTPANQVHTVEKLLQAVTYTDVHGIGIKRSFQDMENV